MPEPKIVLPLTRCCHCGKWIDPTFGADSPAEHQEARGTKRDPLAPGDYENICAPCNYEKGLRGYPMGWHS
jgi:hypothetical protein